MRGEAQCVRRSPRGDRVFPSPLVYVHDARAHTYIHTQAERDRARCRKRIPRDTAERGAPLINDSRVSAIPRPFGSRALLSPTYIPACTGADETKRVVVVVVRVSHSCEYGRSTEQFYFTGSVNMRDAFTNYGENVPAQRWKVTSRTAFSIKIACVPSARTLRARNRYIHGVYCASGERWYVMCFGRILISMAPFVRLVRRRKRRTLSTCPA